MFNMGDLSTYFTARKKVLVFNLLAQTTHSLADLSQHAIIIDLMKLFIIQNDI